MKITRRQLRRIIKEEKARLLREGGGFAATAEEEAHKINSQTGISLVTDQAFWEKMGISTGEELAKEMLASTYSDYYKGLYGFRPRWNMEKINAMSVDEIQAEIDQLDREAAQMAEEDPDEWMEDRFREDQDLGATMVAAVKANPEDIPEEYLEYEAPTQQGMGRRPAGSKAQRRMESKMRITKRQLRRIIREAVNEAREPMTPDYVYKQLMGKQEFGPRKGLTRMEMAMDAITAGDLRAAANRVMDALWIDDPPVGADEELEGLLAGVQTEDELASIAAEWGTRHFRGNW